MQWDKDIFSRTVLGCCTSDKIKVVKVLPVRLHFSSAQVNMHSEL